MTLKNKQWMSDSELEVYIPDDLQDEWFTMLGYDEDGNVSHRWSAVSDEEPHSGNLEHRKLMVQIANDFFNDYHIPLTVSNVKDVDDELVWLVSKKPQSGMNENFADGKVKGKSRPGRVKRAGASCNGSVTDLRKRAKNSGGEKAKMYHWCANMKSGRKKTNEGSVEDLEKDLKHPYSYDAIDHMMQTIARKHKITPKKLHDLFVEKHGQIPDKWIRNK